MSHIILAGAVHGYSTALTASSFVLDKLSLGGLADLSFSSAAVVPLVDNPTQYFVRRDGNDPNKKVRVYDSRGTQVYAIERLSLLNPVWAMVSVPHRHVVATINTSLWNQGVTFHTKAGVGRRPISRGLGRRSFYADGVKHQWLAAKFLDQVVNPGQGLAEARRRVAHARLMRQFRLDYEVLVDESLVDPIYVLTTAFVSMLTQWGCGASTDDVGPVYVKREPSSVPSTLEAPTPEVYSRHLY